MSNFLAFLDSLDVEHQVRTTKTNADFDTAMANYVPPVFQSQAVTEVVEFTPTQKTILKAAHRKAQDKSKVFSTVRALRNQGHDVEFIISFAKHELEFNRLFGKKLEQKVRETVALSDQWDIHRNTILIWDNLIKHTVDINQSKVRKDAKHLFPFLLTIASLFICKDANPKAILATRIVRNVGASSTLNEVDLEIPSQKRKWLALEKYGYIKFYKGSMGGDSNRVEILHNDNLYSLEQKQKAVATLLSFIKHPALHAVLAKLLEAVAACEDAPRYDNSDLYNLVTDLLAVFTPLAEELIYNRKAERLIDSADYDQALVDEAEEASEKVTQYLKEGRTLVLIGSEKPTDNKINSLQVTTGAQKIEAINSSQMTALQKHSAKLALVKEHRMIHLADGIEF